MRIIIAIIISFHEPFEVTFRHRRRVELCIKNMHLKSLIKSHILISTFEMKSDKQANGIINISETAIYQN